LFWTEVLAAGVQVALAVLLIPLVGIDGAGYAFVGLYLWHTIVIYLVVRRVSGFRWTRGNLVLGCVYLAAAGGAIAAFQIMGPWVALASVALLTLAVGSYSLLEILRLAPEVIPAPLRRMVPQRFG